MKIIGTRFYETSDNCYFTALIGNTNGEQYKIVLEGEMIPDRQRHLPWVTSPEAIVISRFATEEYTGTDVAELIAQAEARTIELGGEIRRRKSVPARVVT